MSVVFLSFVFLRKRVIYLLYHAFPLFSFLLCFDVLLYFVLFCFVFLSCFEGSLFSIGKRIGTYANNLADQTVLVAGVGVVRMFQLVFLVSVKRCDFRRHPHGSSPTLAVARSSLRISWRGGRTNNAQCDFCRLDMTGDLDMGGNC